MLEINLLPESERRVGSSSISEFHKTPLVIIVAALMVAFALALWFPLQLSRVRLNQLKAKAEVLQPKKDEVDELQRLTHHLRSQETAFKTLKTDYRLWSKRLNIISDHTPDGVWFTDLTLDEKGLIIQGSAIGQKGSDEMKSVGQFVQELKSDPDIASAIHDLQIESIKRSTEKDTEVVYFTLSGAVATEPTP